MHKAPGSVARMMGEKGLEVDLPWGTMVGSKWSSVVDLSCTRLFVF